MIKKEKEYLKSLLGEIKYESFKKIYVSENKYIYGVISPQNQKTILTKWFEVKTLTNSVVSLDRQIKYSLLLGMECAYSKELTDNFDLLRDPTEPEMEAYYYLENAIFRISSLWDVLAQMYNVFYEVGFPARKVHYNNFFRLKVDGGLSRNKKKVIKNNLLKIEDKLLPIKEYLNEKDDTAIDGRWKGNHAYLNSLRNQLAHRNTPSMPSLSNFSFNMKPYPAFMLKRVVEDYNSVSKFILAITNIMLEEFEKEFTSK